MKKLNIAVIGYGRSGKYLHCDFLTSAESALFHLVAIVDEDTGRRELARKEYPDCQVYAHYTDLFGRDDIDVVTNASYSEQHFAITLDLLRHGFHVIVEKPMAKDADQCEVLIQTAKEKGVMLTSFQQSLFAPWHLFIKNTIASGKIGEPVQISIRYNNLSRRWDWQTLQYKLAGSLYNTGPHPIGCALDHLGFDGNTKVAYSKLYCSPMTSGDVDDYAKVILTAPGKPVVDVEVSALDAYSPYLVKVQGTRGTLKVTSSTYEMKYIVDGENIERPVQHTFLRDENCLPMYCGEKLITHEESGIIENAETDLGTDAFYRMVYDHLTQGGPLPVDPENVKKIIGVIAQVHAENPLPVKYSPE